ncbi:MAG: magnesium transporter MgtC [Acidobacteria bacterium]|nr:MAG: magnesium transporter MgtC [Acidobacteriota bacterium]
MDARHSLDLLGSDMGTVLSGTIARLVVAAILGGTIGLERQLRHKPAGLRTNMFICFGAAMFTVLSDQLAGGMGGDHTRVAAQIIPGIGFIGAGSILHARGSVVGLTTAATLFVVGSVGMAAGGGLYVTAIFATLVILIALALLGKLERKFGMRSRLVTYEVTGTGAETVLIEANRVLDEARITMQNVRVAGSAGHVRVLFNVDGSHDEQEQVNVLLHQSTVFATVGSLGAVEHE